MPFGMSLMCRFVTALCKDVYDVGAVWICSSVVWALVCVSLRQIIFGDCACDRSGAWFQVDFCLSLLAPWERFRVEHGYCLSTSVVGLEFYKHFKQGFVYVFWPLAYCLVTLANVREQQRRELEQHPVPVQQPVPQDPPPASNIDVIPMDSVPRTHRGTGDVLEAVQQALVAEQGLVAECCVCGDNKVCEWRCPQCVEARMCDTCYNNDMHEVRGRANPAYRGRCLIHPTAHDMHKVAVAVHVVMTQRGRREAEVYAIETE